MPSRFSFWLFCGNENTCLRLLLYRTKKSRKYPDYELLKNNFKKHHNFLYDLLSEIYLALYPPIEGPL